MAKIIDTTFSYSILVLVWRSFTLTIAAYELTKRVNHMATFVEILMFLLISLLQLFTLCIVAENCKDYGLKLENSCLQRTWCDIFSTNDARIKGNRFCLLVIATRSLSPLQFTAGPFYRLSLESFTSLCGLLLSYYMFFFTWKIAHTHINNGGQQN